jgi:hypothetical protein
MTRSLVRLADRIERETATDPDSKERAAHIREVARNLNRSGAATQSQNRATPSGFMARQGRRTKRPSIASLRSSYGSATRPAQSTVPAIERTAAEIDNGHVTR